MRKSVCAWAALIVIVIGTRAVAGEADAKARAERLLQMLVKEKYENFHSAFDETMTSAMSTDQVRATWEATVARYGRFSGHDGPNASEVGPGMTAVDFNCRFERGALKVRLVIDSEQRITGFWFLPPDEGSAEAKPDAATTERETARARALVALLTRQKYEEFRSRSNDEVRQALSAEQLEQAWAGMQGSYGPYRPAPQATVEFQSGLTVVTLSAWFGEHAFHLKFTFDASDLVAGFLMTPDTTKVEYEAPDYVDRGRFTEREVTVSAGKYALPGTLTVPKRAGSAPGLPAVVLVHGSGSHDQDETVFAQKPFRDLAWGLASRGVAVLRYEKRTHKYPTAHTDDTITLDDETIEDAVAGARLLMKTEGIDPARVFVVGHSLGAIAAPFVAKAEPRLAGIVLLAGCSRSLIDVVEDQFDYLAAVDGEVTELERRQLDEARQALADLRAGRTDGESINGLPRKYLHMMTRYDPVAAARQLTLPMLIAQGGRDYQVTMKDYELWRSALAGRPNVTFRLFQQCNHLFNAGEGPSSPAEYTRPDHVDAPVIEALARWVADPSAE